MKFFGEVSASLSSTNTKICRIERRHIHETDRRSNYYGLVLRAGQSGEWQDCYEDFPQRVGKLWRPPNPQWFTADTDVEYIQAKLAGQRSSLSSVVSCPSFRAAWLPPTPQFAEWVLSPPTATCGKVGPVVPALRPNFTSDSLGDVPRGTQAARTGIPHGAHPARAAPRGRASAYPRTPVCMH